MDKVPPWCGQPSDRGRLKNRTGHREMMMMMMMTMMMKWTCEELTVRRYIRLPQQLMSRTSSKCRRHRRVMRFMRRTTATTNTTLVQFTYPVRRCRFYCATLC